MCVDKLCVRTQSHFYVPCKYLNKQRIDEMWHSGENKGMN